jgi:hypothetical protein
MLESYFQEKIETLRRELIDAIIKELKEHNLTSFDFPSGVDISELPCQFFYDKHGNLVNGYAKKITICNEKHLSILMEDEDECKTTTIKTHSHWNAHDVHFLLEIYEWLSYYIWRSHDFQRQPQE